MTDVVHCWRCIRLILAIRATGGRAIIDGLDRYHRRYHAR